MTACEICKAPDGTKIEGLTVCSPCHEQSTTPSAPSTVRWCGYCKRPLLDLREHGKGCCDVGGISMTYSYIEVPVVLGPKGFEAKRPAAMDAALDLHVAIAMNGLGKLLNLIRRPVRGPELLQGFVRTLPFKPYQPSGCPFCGSVDALKLRLDRHGHDLFSVVCAASEDGCGAQGGMAPTKAGGVTLWNIRASAPNQLDQTEWLEAATSAEYGD